MTRVGIIIFLLLGGTSAWAQTTAAPPLQVGLLAGLSFTGRTDLAAIPVLTGESGRFGFQGGVTLTWVPKPELGLQTGLLFAQKGYVTGSSFNLFGGGASSNTKWRLNYLDLPVAVQLHPLRESRGWFVEAGPQISYLLAANYEDISNPAQVSNGSAIDAYRRVQGGYLVGVGFHGGNRPVSIGLRYTQDLAPVWRDFQLPPGLSLIGADGKNWGLQLYVGYHFNRR